MGLGASVSQGQPSRDHDLLANTGGLLMMLEVNGGSVLPGECPPPPQAHTAVLSGHPLNSTLLSLLFPFLAQNQRKSSKVSPRTFNFSLYSYPVPTFTFSNLASCLLLRQLLSNHLFKFVISYFALNSKKLSFLTNTPEDNPKCFQNNILSYSLKKATFLNFLTH